jgi:hypothetical protein
MKQVRIIATHSGREFARARITNERRIFYDHFQVPAEQKPLERSNEILRI